MQVFKAEAMKELDRIAIEDYEIPGASLMELAGRGAAQHVRELCPKPGPVALVCGAGNNGGDGYVMARYLANWGYDVTVLRMAPRDRIAGDAKIYLTAIERMMESGAPVQIVAADPSGRVRAELATRGPWIAIVDAILGTGLSREVRGAQADAIDAVNTMRHQNPDMRVVSVDLPSGLNADTGRPMGQAIKADLTATFAALKLGLTQFPGVSFAGRIETIDIGFPHQVYERFQTRTDEPAYNLLETTDFQEALPELAPDAHKGTAGHLLVVAGSHGRSGAAVLSALSALRSGAGLVTLATTGPARMECAMQSPEVMTVAWSATDDPQQTDLSNLQALWEGKDAIAIGPGVPRTEGMAKVVEMALRHFPGPIVVDADGLNVLADHDLVECVRVGGARVVLTPHPGEMARMMEVATSLVQSDRVGVSWKLSQKLETCVVLKGARTVIADWPGRRVDINPTGNQGMATAGSGDVLTGVAGAFLARGVSPGDAARAAVFVHGRAGDNAADGSSPEGVIAGDLIAELPRALIR